MEGCTFGNRITVIKREEEQKMYVMECKEFVVIPIAYNDFCNDIQKIIIQGELTGPISVERILKKQDFNEVVKYITTDMQEKNRDRIYVIDMQDIISYTEKIFAELTEIEGLPIVIVNINNKIRSYMREDLKKGFIEVQEDVFALNENSKKQYYKFENEIKNIYHLECCNIVKWMTDCIKEKDLGVLKPLDSSGIFCNKYVNAKKLFRNPDKHGFIIYQLIRKISTKRTEIDALVSASRNGANLASVIGWLLDIKVVYCANLGPKFSLMTHNIERNIRENKRYFFIYDFMCLGTELKVLNAIVGVRGAHLVGGMGIANYVSLSEEDARFSVLGKMESLVDVKKENIGYKIAGAKEEIKLLLQEDDEIYVCRLQRI